MNGPDDIPVPDGPPAGDDLEDEGPDPREGDLTMLGPNALDPTLAQALELKRRLDEKRRRLKQPEKV